jgi:hypothetical protein
MEAVAHAEQMACGQCSKSCACEEVSCCVRGGQPAQEPLPVLPPAKALNLDLKGRALTPAHLLESFSPELHFSAPQLRLPLKRTAVPVYYWNCSLLI